MGDYDIAELEEEIDSLRTQVSRLTEAMADCRAHGVHQESVIVRLRQELNEMRAGQKSRNR